MSRHAVIDVALAPGWFGKVPALGDFVTRRLPGAFVTHWDAWLARGIADLRGSEGESARDHLLTFPIWRFLAPPGAIDARGWLGLLAPSVDRVGRCFPLTVASALEAAAFARCDLQSVAHALDGWALAVSQVLDDDDLDAFDASLAAITLEAGPALAPGADPLEPDSDLVRLGAYRNSYAEFLCRLGAAQMKAWSADRWIWWAPPTGLAPGEVLASRTLDAPALFRTLVAAPAAATAPAPGHGC